MRALTVASPGPSREDPGEATNTQPTKIAAPLRGAGIPPYAIPLLPTGDAVASRLSTIFEQEETEGTEEMCNPVIPL